MAGFAVFMTILTIALVGLLVACVMSVALYVVAKRRIRSGASNRKATVVGAVAPFLGLLWFVVAFLIHVQISNRFAHQDCGLSGDPYVTLPNRYVLGSLNTYSGYIKAPGYQTDAPVAGPGYVRSIIDLRFSDPYFVGTQFDFKTSSMRSFVFDTRTREFHASEQNSREGRPLDPSDQAALDAWADAQTHARNDPDSYWNLYHQYRHRWPKYVFLALVLAGEVGTFFWFHKSWNMRLAETTTESM
jgi:hypothetical protein